MGGVGAVAALSSTAGASPLPNWAAEYTALSSTDAGGEGFWELVKAQFPLRAGLILVNAANLCPAPYPVEETVFGLTRDVDADASFQNRKKFSDLQEDSRRALARYLGAGPEEIVITRNTTEGNNAVINGLDLGKGDEVVLWDQNHPTNGVAWDVRAERYGFLVKRVTTPVLAESPEELIRPFRRALSRTTKVLAFSHVSNVSGVGLPAKELCQMAREREILTLIDGAQTFGAFRVNLHAMGCDFYTGSAHKWFMGPKETGVLYVRRERIAGLWPSIVGAFWEDWREKGAQKFETFGQRDDARLAAVGKTVSFHQHIGEARVEQRVRELTLLLKNELRKIPGVKLYTPMAPELSGGVVVFSVPEVDPRRAFQYLYKRYRIGCAGIGGPFAGIRFCPHVYNLVEEMDKLVAAVADVSKNGVG
jgi:selenocysteine lyase/cysteine desulfurase